MYTAYILSKSKVLKRRIHMDKTKLMLAEAEYKQLTTPYMNQSTLTEAGEEFVLPDYYPEVRRVVSALCRVLPEAWYDNGDSVEQGGVVAFTVLYLGDDGSLTAAPLTTDFTAVLPIQSNGERSSAVYSVDTSVENVTCRATGPRRLVLRARIRTAAVGERRQSMDVQICDIGGASATAAEKLSVQHMEKQVQSMRRAIGRITGNVSGELREHSGTKPVMCDGEIMVNEAVLSDGNVTVKGEAVLWCICFGADGLYYKTSSKVPFEENLSLEGESLTDGCARAWGRCAAVNLRDSEDGTFTWDMEYDLECEAACNVPVSVTADMYSTMWSGNAVTDECDSLSLLKCGGGRLSLNGNMRRSENGAAGDYVIGSFGKVSCERLERNGKRLSLTGSADVKVLICGGGEVTEESVRLPFRYETDCTAEGDGELWWRCDASAVETGARLEGSEIYVTAELSLSVFVGLRSRVPYVTCLRLDRSAEKDASGDAVRIYYPSEGETAWDIAKKYRIPKNNVGEVTENGVIIE